MTWYEILGVIASILTVVEFVLRLLDVPSVLQRVRRSWLRLFSIRNARSTPSESSALNTSQYQESSAPDFAASHIKDEIDAKKHGINDYPLVQVKVGTLSSNITNYPVSYEIFRFRGRLVTEVFLEHGYGSNSQKLYARPDGKYLVYVEQDHRHDYWTSYLAGAMVGGETEYPLTISQVQDSFLELATEAGLCRLNNV